MCEGGGKVVAVSSGVTERAHLALECLSVECVQVVYRAVVILTAAIFMLGCWYGVRYGSVILPYAHVEQSQLQ
jgi:hypothetical protein